MGPDSTSPSGPATHSSVESQFVHGSSSNISLPSSVSPAATSASDVNHDSEAESDKKEAPEVFDIVHSNSSTVRSVNGKADRYLASPNTFTLDRSQSNIWYYRESRIPLIRRYDVQRCLSGGDYPTSNSTCRAALSFMLSGRNPGDKLRQAFSLGSTSRDDEVRQTWANSLVYAKQSPGNWTDVDLQELSRAFVFQAINTYEGPLDPLLDFILALRPYFQCPSSKRNRLTDALEHEVGNIFSFTWKADSEESVSPRTAHYDHYVAGALNLAKFMGDLFGLRLVRRPILTFGMRMLYTNLVSYQHIEALRYLVLHSGPSLWGDNSWTDRETYVAAFTQAVPSALNGRSLYDFLPERGGRLAAARWCEDLKSLFDRLSVAQSSGGGSVDDSGPSLLLKV